jgi:hypothetical protein
VHLARLDQLPGLPQHLLAVHVVGPSVEGRLLLEGEQLEVVRGPAPEAPSQLDGPLVAAVATPPPSILGDEPAPGEGVVATSRSGKILSPSRKPYL